MPLDVLTDTAATATRVDVQRVAHFTDTYLPRRDGVVTSLHTLLAALREQGCGGLTVAPRHPAEQAGADLMTVGSAPCGVAHLRLATWPTARHVERVAAWRPQLIHVHTPGPVGLLGVLAARRLGLPLVQTYHTDLHAYADAYRVPAVALRALLDLYARRLRVPRPALGTGRSRRHAVLDAANEVLLGDCSAVVVPTPAVLSRAALPVPPERVFLVPAGVPERLVTPADAARFRARHGIASAERVVLFVGRVNREKGVELLIPAFARVAAAVPDARLVLVGAVYEPRWLRRMLDAHGLGGGRVVVTGQLPPDEVAAAYATAAVFAFPSRTDTQGLVLQEAALAGVPSVLADPALHRTGALGDAAMLAGADPHRYGDALTWLLTDPVAARDLGARARRRALAHTPARYAATMREVYTLAASRTVAAPVATASAHRPG